MPEDTYNGWTNRETWLVNLWLTNERYLYDCARGCHSAEEIKDLVEELIEDAGETTRIGLIADLLNTALARVDWYEIYQNFAKDR